MLLSDAMGGSGLTQTEAADVLGRLAPHWGGARLYISHHSVLRDRRSAAPDGAAEQFLQALRRAIHASLEASRSGDGRLSAEATAIHDSIALYLQGARVDVDSMFYKAARDKVADKVAQPS